MTHRAAALIGCRFMGRLIATQRREQVNTLNLTLQGKQLQLVAVAANGKVVSQVKKYANVAAAQVALANMVEAAKGQKAKVNVTFH